MTRREHTVKTLDVYVGHALIWLLIMFLLGIAVWWAWDEILFLRDTLDAIA